MGRLHSHLRRRQSHSLQYDRVVHNSDPPEIVEPFGSRESTKGRGLKSGGEGSCAILDMAAEITCISAPRDLQLRRTGPAIL